MRCIAGGRGGEGIGVQHPLRERRRADSEVCPLRTSSDRAEELAHDAPAGLPFQRSGPRAQNAYARAARGLSDRAHQARLADARGPVDDDHAARPGTDLLELPLERGQLEAALQQAIAHLLSLGRVCRWCP